MKLLGLRLDDHDTNMCLYDNGKLSYIKTERIYQIKHHAYNNADQWVVDLKRIFGLTPEDIDEIAIVADPLRYGVNQFFDFDVKKYEKLENAECPVFHIEHHLAHALSANMINKTDYQFVFDGVGELFLNKNKTTGTTWSVFKNYKLVDRNTADFEQINPTTIRIHNSFGVEYENLAKHLDIEAEHPEDLPGKLMSLQSFGNQNLKFIEDLRSKLEDIKTQLSVACHPFNYEDFLGSDHVAKLSKLDFAASIHYFLEEQILKIIKQHATPVDKILLTGGCAQNICWNSTIKQEFPNLIVNPHCADDGLAIGAVEYLIQKNNLDPGVFDNFPYVQQDEAPETVPSKQTINTVAELLAQGKIVG